MTKFDYVFCHRKWVLLWVSPLLTPYLFIYVGLYIDGLQIHDAYRVITAFLLAIIWLCHFLFVVGYTIETFSKKYRIWLNKVEQTEQLLVNK